MFLVEQHDWKGWTQLGVVVTAYGDAWGIVGGRTTTQVLAN